MKSRSETLLKDFITASTRDLQERKQDIERAHHNLIQLQQDIKTHYDYICGLPNQEAREVKNILFTLELVLASLNSLYERT